MNEEIQKACDCAEFTVRDLMEAKSKACYTEKIVINEALDHIRRGLTLINQLNIAVNGCRDVYRP